MFLSLLYHRHMEDFVTWVDTSKLKRTVMRYNDEVSDSPPLSIETWIFKTSSSSMISICFEMNPVFTLGSSYY